MANANANADAPHAELTSRSAHVEAEPMSRPWGLREFRMFDPEGNILACARPFD